MLGAPAILGNALFVFPLQRLGGQGQVGGTRRRDGGGPAGMRGFDGVWRAGPEDREEAITEEPHFIGWRARGSVCTVFETGRSVGNSELQRISPARCNYQSKTSQLRLNLLRCI